MRQMRCGYQVRIGRDDPQNDSCRKAARDTRQVRSPVAEAARAKGTMLLWFGATSPTETLLRHHGAEFSKCDTAPGFSSGVNIKLNAAPRHIERRHVTVTSVCNARSGDRLSKSPLDMPKADLLRRDAAPAGWSGVILLILDRHPAGAEAGGHA